MRSIKSKFCFYGSEKIMEILRLSHFWKYGVLSPDYWKIDSIMNYVSDLISFVFDIMEDIYSVNMCSSYWNEKLGFNIIYVVLLSIVSFIISGMWFLLFKVAKDIRSFWKNLGIVRDFQVDQMNYQLTNDIGMERDADTRNTLSHFDWIGLQIMNRKYYRRNLNTTKWLMKLEWKADGKQTHFAVNIAKLK